MDNFSESKIASGQPEREVHRHQTVWKKRKELFGEGMTPSVSCSKRIL